MTLLFGWCMDGHHPKCPGAFTSTATHWCGCECHSGLDKQLSPVID